MARHTKARLRRCRNAGVAEHSSATCAGTGGPQAIIIKKLGKDVKKFQEYVDYVYDNPDIAPENFYKLAYLSCSNN